MAKKKRYEEGERVKWQWGDGYGRGTVEKVYTRKVTRKISGAEVTRQASEDEPAYYITQKDGDAVLKSHSEVTKA